MATKNFKGFQLVALANFREAESDKNTLYFVRTSGEKGNGTDGFLYFNGKKYGTAEDAKAALITRYGDIKIGEKDATIAEYVAAEIEKVNTAAGTLSGRVDTLEGKVGSKAVEGGAAATGLFKDVADNKAAIAAEADRVTGVEGTVKTLNGRVTTLEGTKHVDSLGGKTGAITVDGEGGSGAYKVKLAMTNQKLGATISGLGTAAGQNADAFDPAGAADGVKTALVGGATEGYKTLGDLEGKIKAADAKAVVAQQTADAKVASVSGEDGNAIKVDSTIATAPKVSLVLDPTQGNVKLSQSTAGLKAEVEIPAATVTAVKAGDKVLALDGTELTSTISLSVDTSADGEGKKYIRLKGIGGADLGKIDTADFVKDGMLDGSALYTATAATGTVTINATKYDLTGLTANHAYIVLVWNTDAKKDAMAIDVTSLIDTYTAKADGGLVLEDHAFSVNYEKVAKKGDLDAVEGRVTTLEGKVATIQGEGEGSIKKAVADEASRAQAAEQANAAAIATLNGADTVEGSVDKKIKDALKAGAVTLEVKDNDAYLGVTSATIEGKGTVYTLASKADEINKAINDAANAVKVSVINGTYVKGSVDAAGRAITLSEKVQAVADADANVAEKKGLAEASDVKNYVDQKVSDKNVAAEGDTLVSASAADNKVTVRATEALTSAVNKAKTAVQSVNGVSATAVTLDATNIEVGAGVGEQVATAKVNAVLADIYTKLGVVVKADGKTIKEAADHTLSVNLEATSDEKVSAGHIEIKQDANTGALYSMMYYSGDDVDDAITQ